MKYILLCYLFLSGMLAKAQNTFEAIIVDDENEPLIGATVHISTTQGAVTDYNGYVEITNIKDDTIRVRVSFVGYETFYKTYSLPINGIQKISLNHGEELEEVIVTSTRSGRTIDEIPTRVEAIDSEELEEKAIMKSSNIAMVLRESTGIQMQQTSASSANQSIRIQGLDGRYTQLLKDGFPLFGGFSSGLSIMQIPPLDLKQVEILKGSNSTLYGGGAIAGLINLVTYQPEDEKKQRFMIDQTHALGTTLNGFYGQRFDQFGMTFYTSANRQEAYDPNKDDFSDIPRIRSLTINPSFFFYPDDKSSLRLTLNSTIENRLGGDMQVIENNQNGIHQFTEENQSDRYSYQLTYQNQLNKYKALTVKNSLTNFNRKITEPDFQFIGEQWSSFSEIALNYGSSRTNWISGANLYTDKFSEEPYDSLLRDYNYTTVGMFTQNTFDISERYALESGVRIDYAFDFGLFALPRASFLTRLNSKWSARLGGGLGYKLPTIFTEDAENLTYQSILPIDVDQIDAERSIGGNFDINYSTLLGSDWTLSVNQLFFFTQLDDALVFRQNERSQFYYENADGTVTSQGFETNVKLGYKDFKLFANYAYINTQLKYDNLNQQKPLTPKYNIGSVLMYEVHDEWRIGYEAYYTGSQHLSDGSQTKGFWMMGFMVMRKINSLSLYINFENFTDTRQHQLEEFQVDSHTKPDFPELWAPTDGRVINAGLIIDL
ncbi:TonB-dependent receptor [Reichenbachiella versicolor]|uniref:TonB-dependent receptor n=1 Tax=Reichenbachiella versicolor TaxID=1821036 RepID=UPI001C87C0CD|nr:TonB-dependent receptor [Reichenbachiella versicolor]